MLWVYAGIDILGAIKLAKDELPAEAIDLSKVPSDDLAHSVQDYCNHHVTGHIFLGYLDPLVMLHPTEETRLRRGFTQCDMSIVVSNPNILPLSWKNGTSRLRVLERPNYACLAETVHDGGAPHVQDEGEH